MNATLEQELLDLVDRFMNLEFSASITLEDVVRDRTGWDHGAYELWYHYGLPAVKQ